MSATLSPTGRGRRLTALFSASAYIFGVPALLWRTAHWPLPHRVPSLHDLTMALTPGRRPGAEVVIKAFGVVAWILWAQIGVAVVAEIRAQRRGRATALGTVPTWARPLVVRLATIVMTLIPTMGIRPVGATPVPVPAVVATTPVCSNNSLAGASAPAVADSPVTPAAAATATTSYRVRPGDNLWDIAAKELGNPRRYHEIFELNRTRLQQDGRRLTRSGLIRPGWILDLPVAPSGTPEGQPAPIQAATPAPATADPSPSEHRSASASPSEEQVEDIAVAIASGAGNIDPTGPGAADDDAGRPVHQAGLSLLVAGSVIAGLGILRRNRRNARRRHHRFPPPADSLVDVEREVRAIASNEAPLWVAAAVRHLAGSLGDEGAPPPPDVLAVRAGELGVEVLIARPWPQSPGRFIPLDDGHTWRLDPAVELKELEDLARSVPSYLTALATVGESETGAVLIDLDHAGTLLVEGHSGHTGAVLGSIALELATATWADLVDLCLVGAPEPFAGLDRLERVRILTRGEAVATLKRCAGSPGVGGLTAAALGDIPPGPTVAVVWPGVLTEDELADLAAVAEPHTGLVMVVAGGVPSAGWRLTINESGNGLLAPVGLSLTVPTATETIDALALLLVDAATESTETLVEGQAGADPAQSPNSFGDTVPGAPEAFEPTAMSPVASDCFGEPHGDDQVPVEPPLSVDLSEEGQKDDASPIAEVRILGPVEITWRGPAPQRPQPGELVAYLATHRYPVNGDRIRLALWPARVDDDRFGERNKSTLWALTSRTRQALGKDDAGQDLLPKEAGNLLSLSPAVASDWERFRRFVDRARRDPANAIEILVQALDLVRGRPFQDVRSGYAWVELEHLDAEIDAVVTDAALDLVDLALAAGDITSARHAIRQGLLGCPGSEPLLRAAMRVAHAAGDQPGVERAWRDIERVTGELGFEPHPESIDLYRTLRYQSAKT